MVINDKQELFDYINKENRSQDTIDAMSFFAHGTAFDMPRVSNPGYDGKYALALGYGGHGEHNNALNIFTSELNNINSSSFSKKAYTYFGACRTGNNFNGVSFAQEWVNITGGSAKAATGKGVINGRTDYTKIFPSPFPGLDTIMSLLGDRGKTERQKARDVYGYSTSGCKNYPTVNDGGKWKTFYPN